MDTNTNGPSSGHLPQVPGLSPEERKQIMDEVARQETRRKNSSLRVVALVVDGTERARLDLDAGHECAFAIEEGAELIELRALSPGEDVLLAVFPVPYAQCQGIAAFSDALFRRGLRRLDLDIVPSPASAEGPRRAAVTVRYSANPLTRFLRAQSEKPAWLPGLQFAAGALCLLALGWMLGTYTYKRSTPVHQAASTPATAANPVAKPATERTPPALPHPAAAFAFLLIPDEQIVRGAGSPGWSSVTVPRQPVVLTLQLPVDRADAHRTFNATLREFLGREVILMERRLQAHPTSSGVTAVTFPVPSVLLKHQQDYSVDLRVQTAGGSEELSSYSFHALVAPDNPN